MLGVAAVESSQLLRARYTVLLFEFVVNASMGFAAFTSGIYRFCILLGGGTNEKRSRRYCILMPWNLLGIWAEPMMGVVMLALSVDRVLAVSFPLWYYKKMLLLQRCQVIDKLC
ncbi:hypothetical protein AB6A40_005881 [Gnathostoma spinigerum]|uniref:Uncharacterized protein n=1 Tax=Gnathostoma spinigerum TaxID=75299 RepID=A0ABD6ER67_9BILA